MQDIDWKSEKAAEAYARSDFNTAVALLDEVIAASPNSPHGLGSRHLRALAYESGHTPSGVSLERALADFEVLAKASDVVGSVGIVGVARVLASMDMSLHVNRIMELCESACALDRSAKAALVIGDVYSKVHGNEKMAREWYSKAYRGGEAEGLRKIAVSHERDGHGLRARVFAIRFALAPGGGRLTS